MIIQLNKKMNILSSLGIMLVVAGHTGFTFLDWFPIFSFHMALFMFISGYFFKDRTFKSFIRNKIYHLLIPLLLWNALYGIVINFLADNGMTQLYHKSISLQSLLWDPFTMGWQFNFNAPTWFVGTLFLVQVIYWGLYRGSGKKMMLIWMSVIALHIFSLYMAFHGWAQYHDLDAWSNVKLGVARALFCLMFYHLGHIYHIYFEEKDIFSLDKIVGLFILNAFLIGFVSPQIWMDVRPMYFPVHKYWLPLVEACSGIWLFLQIASLLQQHVKEESLIHYIGRHTFAIMTHQQFFFWILNTMIFGLTYFNVYKLSSFNYDLYMKDIYYRIEAHPPVNQLLYLIAGVMGPIICCWIYERYIKMHIANICLNMKSSIIVIKYYVRGGAKVINMEVKVGCYAG